MAPGYLEQLFSLEGKTAIITGATGGLGREMTLALANAGADIVSIALPGDSNSKSLETLVKGTGRHMSSFECNLLEPMSLRACFESIWKSNVIPDILVTCAGVMRRGTIEDMQDEDIDLILGVNLRAMYIAGQEFGRRLIHLNRPGKIINIASVTSFHANVLTSIYSTSKGGVIQMTKAFSNEWASKGIQVNSIAPGFMRTAMTESNASNEEYTAQLMTRVPAKRWGLPSDLLGAAIFLASPASDFVTGTSIIVDGGYVGK